MLREGPLSGILKLEKVESRALELLRVQIQDHTPSPPPPNPFHLHPGRGHLAGPSDTTRPIPLGD